VLHRRRARVTRALPRQIVALGAFAIAATIGGATAAANPGPADPPSVVKHLDPKLDHRIRAVNVELDRLSRQNEQLDEKYNVAAAAVTAAQQTSRRAQQTADRAAARYRVAHAQFVQAVTQQYEGGPDPSMGTLLTSDAPQQYLDNLTMAGYLSSQLAATVRADQAARADASRATSHATAAVAAARTKETALAERRAALRQRSQRFQQLLDTLTARQRRERAHARAVAAARARAELAAVHQQVGTAAPLAVSGSGSVQAVIAFAEAQVGKAYVFAAAGPDAYDCSGLTMAAWAQAGVQLPHSAAEQYNYGTHVAYSQLQPGDLIFLYSPISHVELYVGNDLAVSAADESIGIVYVHPSQDLTDYAGATRLAG
jgi:peptidoglycan DL-endopeptidase CwlO